MTSDDDLDRELRRLFSDGRLDVPPRDGAETEILAGARRVRRRRTTLAAAGGALTVALLVGAGILVTDLRSGNEQVAAPPSRPELSLSSTTSAQPTAEVVPPPGTSPDTGTPPAGSPPPTTTTSTAPRSSRSLTPSTTSSPRAESVPQATGPVLGPDGYGELQLGMSFEDAKATGLLTGTDTAPNGCGDYQLAEGSSALSGVRISASSGIVSFRATGARTPEKIKIGSTKDQLEAAYPGLTKTGSGYTAATGAGGTYVFTVDDSHNTVASLTLVGSSSC